MPLTPQTGAGWRDFPEPFGLWQAVYHRYRVWRADGTWPRPRAALSPRRSGSRVTLSY